MPMTEEQRAEVKRALKHVDWHDDRLPLLHIAIYTDINEATLRQWKKRGHLAPVDVDDCGRPLFLVIDAWRAQARAEANLWRTQAENLARRNASTAA